MNFRFLSGFLGILTLLAAGSAPAPANPSLPADSIALDQAWNRFLVDHIGSEPALTFPYQHCFRQAAAAHDLPLTLLLAVARGESDFDPGARSHANAHGLMQILWPGTARHLGIHRLSELYVPCRNVDAGTRYLKELLQQYDGNLHLALAAYNYGPQRITSDPQAMPDGAEWYSGYIYRHLQYVLGDRTPKPTADGGPRDYRDDGQLELVVFSTPYRAEAFVQTLQESAPGLRLDWFKVDVGKFRVTLLYDGQSDLERSKNQLTYAGFNIR